MADVVQGFGRLVRGQVESGHPKRALALLRCGYAAYGQVQRHRPAKDLIPSRRFAAVASMDYVRRPLACPESTCVVNVFMPCQIMHALGLHTQVAEGLSCYITGTASQAGFIQCADSCGAAESLCSYHKILTGMALSGTLRAPLMIANTTLACDANMVTFDLLARHWGVPHCVIDVPFSCGDEEVEYVASQLRDFAEVAQEASGRRLDDAKLQEGIERSNASLAAYRRYLDILPQVCLKNDPTSEMYAVLASHLMLGSEPALEFFELLEADAKRALEAASAGGVAGLAGAVAPRRILWAHVLPFYQAPVRAFFASGEDGGFSNQLLCTDMTLDALQGLDPSRPYESMARRLLENAFNGPAERRCEAILSWAKKLKADGIVYFCHWGCRNTSGAVGLMGKLAADAGMPLLVLDGDGCDPQNTSDGQVETRLEAFAEVIDAARLGGDANA